MAFRGHYEHSLDSKERITVPARFRAELANGAVLSAGLDPCIEVYPTAEYTKLIGASGLFDGVPVPAPCSS